MHRAGANEKICTFYLAVKSLFIVTEKENLGQPHANLQACN